MTHPARTFEADFGCACILFGGPIYTIDGIRFEMHPYCGPAVVGKRGQVLATQPGPRHHFWTAVTLWCQQGRRIASDGVTCIYEIPPKPQTVCLVGRHYVEVPPGRDPQEVRREWFSRLGVVPPEDR